MQWANTLDRTTLAYNIQIDFHALCKDYILFETIWQIGSTPYLFTHFVVVCGIASRGWGDRGWGWGGRGLNFTTFLFKTVFYPLKRKFDFECDHIFSINSSKSYYLCRKHISCFAERDIFHCIHFEK